MQCGSQHMPWDFLDAPLAQLLPLTYERPKPPAAVAGPLAPRGGVQAPAFAPFRMAVTSAGAMNPAFNLYGNARQDRQVWSQMPEFYWAAVGNQVKLNIQNVFDMTNAADNHTLYISDQATTTTNAIATVVASTTSSNGIFEQTSSGTVGATPADVTYSGIYHMRVTIRMAVA